MQRLRQRYLNVALEDVLHPLSDTASQVTFEQQSAASSPTAVSQEQLSAQAWFEKGYTQYETGDLAEAIHSYNQAIRLQPNFATAYHNRGLARQKNGDEDGAQRDFKMAERLRGKYAKTSYSSFERLFPLKFPHPFLDRYSTSCHIDLFGVLMYDLK